MLLSALKAKRAGAQTPRPTHGEAVESPRIRHVVGGGSADRCVVLRVPQGSCRRCSRRCSRTGLLGLVMVMVRVAHPRAKLRVAGASRELALEQRQSPGAPRRPAAPDPSAPGPCAWAPRARGPSRGVQVRSDAERAHAESAAFAGRAARPGHRHHQRGWHAQRDEEIRPWVRFRQRGSGPRGVLDDERVDIEGARHVGRDRWLGGPAGRGAPSPPASRALPPSGPTRAVKPLGMRRCRRLGSEQRGPGRGLVLTSPARRPGSGIL